MAESVRDQATDVVVLGAGIVGVTPAYALSERGIAVTLVDRMAPGEETSYGNAGILSSGSILPLNRPSLFASLPSYLANMSASLRWVPAWTARNIDWVLRFLANAVPSRTKPRAAALHGLIGASLRLHRDWIVRAGEPQHNHKTSWLKA